MADLEAYKKRLAERGLVLLGFDGKTLRLGYDMRADKAMRQENRAVSGDEINRFAIECMNIEAEGELFPGIEVVSTAFDYFLGG